ncbi:hypothetical protein C8J56DRAFT_774645 [Mycena floridula]|nr:hypothetical protein C8J56DRAFT_774645 [Mycena floridula]
MASFRDYSFTERDLYPDSSPSSPSPSSSSLANIDPSLLSTPQRRKRVLDPASDPSIATPSKRMRLMGVGLANTASGSFLVTKAKTTHTEMTKLIHPPVLEHVPRDLPEPDWSLLALQQSLSSFQRPVLEKRASDLADSLVKAESIITAQRLIIEAQNAQLIVQNMGMDKMNKTLHAKENKKKTDRTTLFPGGLGRHLMAPELVAAKRKQETEKEEEETKKAGRKVAREKKKGRKERWEQRWKEYLVDYNEAVESWKDEYSRGRQAGTLVKDLPKKPLRRKKEELKSDSEEDSEDDPDGDDGDDEGL